MEVMFSLALVVVVVSAFGVLQLRDDGMMWVVVHALGLVWVIWRRNRWTRKELV
jgi:hypothetical protein